MKRRKEIEKWKEVVIALNNKQFGFSSGIDCGRKYVQEIYLAKK